MRIHQLDKQLTQNNFDALDVKAPFQINPLRVFPPEEDANTRKYRGGAERQKSW